MEQGSTGTGVSDRDSNFVGGVPQVLSAKAAAVLGRTLLVILIATLGYGLYGQIHDIRHSWISLIFAAPVLLACVAQLQKGKVNQALGIFCWGLLIACATAAVFVAGVRSPLLFIVPGLVVIVAYVQSGRNAVLLAIASVGLLSGLVIAEMSGWLSGLELRTPASTLFTYSMTLAAIASISVLMSDHLRLMGERDRRLVGELQVLNDGLEKRVVSRTEEIQTANTALTEILKFNETILLNSPFPMAVYAAEGNCIEANEAFCEIQATTREGLLQYHNIADYKDFGLFDDFQNAVTTQQPQQRELDNRELFGRDLCLEYRFIPVKLTRAQHVLVQLVDLTDRRRREQELHRMAFGDALTKLPNRRMLMDRMAHAIASSKRHNGYGAVLFLDLNKFMHLNDTHGHEAGDQLLIVVADRLRGAVRQTDTVARLGGDEFVVLLEELGPDSTVATESAGKMAEKIRASLTEEYVLGEIRHHGSASIGIALFLGDAIDAEQILKNADAAMYEAKRARSKAEER